MNERTFDCADCGAAMTVPVTPGRRQKFCGDCVRLRKNLKAQADRANVRVANTTCQRPGCGNPIPPGSRADRKWCSSACQAQVSRRVTGAVCENTGTCASCGQSLRGMRADATTCRSAKCRRWAWRHPGQIHPSARARSCPQCSASIDHLNAKAKFCGKACKDRWAMEQNRERYNAKARVWQSSPTGVAYRQAYQHANAAQRQAWARDSRMQDPIRYRNYWKQWAEANPIAVAEVARLRRARQKGNPGSVGVSVRDWERMLARYRGCCAYCGVKATEIHMDHVVPLAKGGRHAIGNVVPACQKCNLTKHAMFLSVWRYRGRRWLLSA